MISNVKVYPERTVKVTFSEIINEIHYMVLCDRLIKFRKIVAHKLGVINISRLHGLLAKKSIDK